MNSNVKVLTAVFLLLCIFIGSPLLLAPGRFLGFFSWAPVDPLISRVLGAAMLGMAWGAWRLLRNSDVRASPVLIEIFAVFSLLSGVGWLRNLAGSYWWPGIWAIMGLFFVFGFAWLLVRVFAVKS